MSHSVIVQSVEGFSVLQGEINYAQPTTTDPVQNLLVIGDDNSGSMQGSRQATCIKKTQLLIEGCGTNTPCIFTT
jgi:hypothetical protein